MPRVSRRAQKDIENLPAALQEKAWAVINSLDEQPSAGHKLLGRLEGLRSARIGRAHRVLYEVTPTEVRVLTVAARRDAYR